MLARLIGCKGYTISLKERNTSTTMILDSLSKRIITFPCRGFNTLYYCTYMYWGSAVEISIKMALEHFVLKFCTSTRAKKMNI